MKAATQTMKAIAEKLRQADPKKWTQEKLANAFGVGDSTVSRWEDEWDVLHNSRTGNVQQPEKPDARVKLTGEGKAQAIVRVKAGESQAQVAADYGVSKSTVSRVLAARMRWCPASIW